jgi:hypothetical protein
MSGLGEDGADVAGRASVRVGHGGTTGQLTQDRASLAEFGHPSVDLRQVLLDEHADLGARRLAAVPQGKDGADLRKVGPAAWASRTNESRATVWGG